MTQIVEPKPIYRALTEENVRSALNDPDKTNPIAIEIARLLEGYMANFQALVERLGYIPPHLLHIEARSPIEKAAMDIAKQMIISTIKK